MKKSFDVKAFRSFFPALNNGYVYFDSAATSLKPVSMIEATRLYYESETTNVGRSTSSLSTQIELKIDEARQLIAQMINACDEQTIIWTSGATASINLVAYGFGIKYLDSESEIIVSELEHHSNLIPWIQIAKITGAKIIKWECSLDGSLSLERLTELLSSKTRLVAITQMSNVTGYLPDISKITELAHRHGAYVLVDGAQGIVHEAIDVQKDDIDFYVMSAHKYYGPTGVGILYGKKSLLDEMMIWQGGGKMLNQTSFYDFSAAELPFKFEAGTLNIAGILGFDASIRFMKEYSQENIQHYVHDLSQYLLSKIERIHQDDIICLSDDSSPILSFSHKNIHSHDIALLLAEQNIIVREGKLCAHPLLDKFNLDSVFRVSLMPYNTKEEIDSFWKALNIAIELLN